MTAGVPWDTLADHIHVLDLSPQQIRAATPKKSDISALTYAQQRLTSADTPQFLLGAAYRIIGQLGPWAVFNPVVAVALFYSLIVARYASDREQARYAAHGADFLLDALRPNLSSRLSRTPDRLMDMQQEFAGLLSRSRQLKQLEDSQQPARVILAHARDWFGARVDARDLDRWRSMTPTAMATDILKSRHHGRRRISEKSLRDYRRLAAKAEDIDEAWHGFIDHLKQRPESDQRRIAMALPPIPSPPPPPETSGA
jgi:hypothetical protein